MIRQPELNRPTVLETGTTPLASGREPSPPLDVFLYGLVIFGIALAFQGSRGLFEPDEGRYADAALAMFRSGDWFVPRLQGLVYLDKPPAIYWTIAAGFKLLGVNEWGARIGQSLALSATACLVAAWSGAAWGKRVGRLTGAAYVTTLLPGLAANVLTPDTLLVLWTTAASFSYWRWRESQPLGERWRWALLLGVSIGLALLTKGTSALVFVAPMVAFGLWDPGPRRFLSRPELWAAALVGTAVGLSWYAGVSRDLPGAAAYFLDNQVAGRLWKDTYDRNSGWWAGIRIYGPVLVFGGLPWSLTWLSRWRSKEERTRLSTLWRDPLHRYLILSTVLPLVVFGLAKSKLSLYILPIAPYLVMLTISQARSSAPARWGRRVLIAAMVLILLKGAAAYVPSKRDARELAQALGGAGVTASECVDALGVKAHGLGFYGFERSSWHTIWPEPYPYFEAPLALAEDLGELLDRCDGRARFLVKTKHRLMALSFFAPAQLTCSDEPISDEVTLFSCAGRGAGATAPAEGRR